MIYRTKDCIFSVNDGESLPNCCGVNVIGDFQIKYSRQGRRQKLLTPVEAFRKMIQDHARRCGAVCFTDIISFADPDSDERYDSEDYGIIGHWFAGKDSRDEIFRSWTHKNKFYFPHFTFFRNPASGNDLVMCVVTVRDLLRAKK